MRKEIKVVCFALVMTSYMLSSCGSKETPKETLVPAPTTVAQTTEAPTTVEPTRDPKDEMLVEFMKEQILEYYPDMTLPDIDQWTISNRGYGRSTGYCTVKTDTEPDTEQKLVIEVEATNPNKGEYVLKRLKIGDTNVYEEEDNAAPEGAKESTAVETTASNKESDIDKKIAEMKAKSKIPSDLEIYTYIEYAVQKDFYPKAKFPHGDAWTIITNDNFRFKGSCQMQRTKDSPKEKLECIIKFTDDTYTTYDLIELDIGGEVLFRNNNKSDDLPAKDTGNDITSPKNTQIYNDVLDQLDNYDDEDEGFKAIAPKYGMTAEELKQFMWDFMEAYYG